MPTDSEKVLEMARMLYADEARCLNLLNEGSQTEHEATHSCYRTFIRAAFAVIEGSVSCIKYAALNTSAQSKIKLSTAEMFLLGETYYKAKENGEIDDQAPLTTPLKNNIMFAFRMYAHVHGATFRFDLKNYSWEDLKKVKKIRNTLTHPKKIEDIQVTEDAAKEVAKASIWLGRNIASLLRCCNPSMGNKIQEFEEQLNDLEQLQKDGI